MKTFEHFEAIELTEYELLMIRGGDGEGDDGLGEGDLIIIPD
jgi:hypothetical protein